MRNSNPLDNDVKFLKGVGDYRALILNKLNIFSILDVLEHFPRTYINRNLETTIADLQPDTISAIVGKIKYVEEKQTSTGKKQLIASISDGKRIMKCVWFQYNEWIQKQLVVEKDIWVNGMVKEFSGLFQIIHPDFEILESSSPEQEQFWRSRTLLPVYPLTDKLSMNILRNLVYNAYHLYNEKIEENLPEDLRIKFGFMDRKSTLEKIHFPDPGDDFEVLRKRFVFEELFYNQLMLARTKGLRDNVPQGKSFILHKTYTTKLKESLPFKLTKAQAKVITEIVKDMLEPVQMNRLLQGDVGSGKTIVVLFAMLLALENNYQATLLAPTELLAEQHFKKFQELLSNQKQITICLLKGGNYKGKSLIKKAIADGSAMIVIGTHALIQKDVTFANLGLVVIDEQHKFGVVQRAELCQRNNHPDLLYLSATPIPRSLALTVYGDLEVSTIDELPPTRKPVETFWRGSDKKPNVYDFIKKQLIQGQQAYIVCPLIKESEKLDLLSATTLYEELQRDIFKDYRVALLHGKMKPLEKDQIMQDFLHKKTHILVSTTVIEVGIDVPNATVMMIEHAERFGLSQLHQLRGRVGRGSEKSYCIMISYYPMSNTAKERLDMMRETNDGFKIAEKDLEIRGPGDFFGTAQSGIPGFKFANIIRDQQVIKEARAMAFEIIKDDFNMEKEKNSLIKKYYETHHLANEKLFKY